MVRTAVTLALVLALVAVAVLMAGCPKPDDDPGVAGPGPMGPGPAANAVADETDNAEATADTTESAANTEPDEAVTGGEIAWVSDYEEGLKTAQAENKPVMIDIFSYSCGPCLDMDDKTWPDPEVVEKAKEFVCIKTDTAVDDSAAMKYGTQYIPHLVFAKPDGTKIMDDVGFKSPSDMIAMMDKALAVQ